MARATTPTLTRRTAFGTAACSSPPSARSFFTCRVTLSDGGVCSSRPRPRATTNSDLAPSAVVVSHHARARAGRACACSPTTHPGSFRCALHRGGRPTAAATAARGATSSGLHGATTRRSAMANSLVRIAAVEGGDHVRRALAALIRPSSHNQPRRAAFRPLPSRLSAMSAATSSSSPQRVHGPTQ